MRCNGMDSSRDSGWVRAASFDATRCIPAGWTRFPEDPLDRNAFLAFALSFLVLSVWMTWEAKRHPAPTPSEIALQTGEPAIPGSAETPPATATQQPAPIEASAPPTRVASAAGPEELVEIHPELSVAWIERNVPYTPASMTKFLEGMRKAGLQ